VKLIDVDVVDPQCVKAAAHALVQPLRAGIPDQPAVLDEADSTLGRDDDLLSTMIEIVSKGLAEQPLGLPEPVDVRGVEEVDPPVTGRPHRLECDGDVEIPVGPPELCRAVDDRRDLQSGAAESDLFHRVSPEGSPPRSLFQDSTTIALVNERSFICGGKCRASRSWSLRSADVEQDHRR
jgi:hypothetical protein